MDNRVLLQLARQSIRDYLDGRETRIPNDKEFWEKRGVFVTFTMNGELRGCIGFPYPTLPLGEAIVEAARSAAFSDPRFSPLEKEELEDVKIEISVLSVPEQIPVKPEKIKIGRDGLMCEYGGKGGLLLPQVATEYGMSSLEFLEAVCEKAGLNSNAWKNPDFSLWKFQAEITREK